MKPTIVSLRRQFLWLVMLLAFIGLLRLLAGESALTRFQERTAGVAEGLRANQAMLQAMTDAETGVRGYQLTGDPVFLQPYTAARIAYSAALRDATAADTSGLTRQRLAEQDTAAQAWLPEFAAPIAATPAGHPGLEAQQSLRGKTLFDAYRVSADSAGTADDFTGRRSGKPAGALRAV